MISRMQEQAIKAKYEALKSELDERARRLWAATEALSLGHGGVATVARVTGLAESTVRHGTQEVTGPSTPPESPRRLRRQGAGRKRLTTPNQQLLQALDALVEPTARGDPLSPLRWTCKSTRRLAKELCQQGHPVSHSKVGQLLQALHYSVQGTRKTREGTAHPDRNAQFEYINARVKDFPHRGQPVVAIETKKKALVGDFANGGREYQPQGVPEPVRVHDVPDRRLGKVMPSGVSALTQNCGWVSVGVDHATAEFAVATVQQWWRRMGHQMYPTAQQVLRTADGGGRTGSRSRLWKVELHKLRDATGLEVQVGHFPPGPSTWHKSEHRLCCHSTENWRGRPLVTQEVIVNLMANTTTEAGLHVEAGLDSTPYETGKKVSDEALAQVTLYPADVHGNDWNYVIKPRDTNQ
jgi:Rhodopirellula transposase DDE domain